MVKLPPEQQQNYLDAAPEVFSPVPGGWGRGGATRVCLKLAKKPLTRKALETAWQAQQAPKQEREKITFLNEPPSRCRRQPEIRPRGAPFAARGWIPSVPGPLLTRKALSAPGVRDRTPRPVP